MFSTLIKKVFGSRNERVLKSLQYRVQQINAFEPTLKGLSDEQLRHQTAVFKQRLAAGESLDSILVEAFATVRETSVRTIGLRHYDTQLLGGLVLHLGKIAEMRTGEGKTLVATLPAYLNALTGQGVHVVTVNDYLAQRDANWMRPIYEFLELTVAGMQDNLPHDEKQQAYLCDITYGTNNEFGFDYLRDNMTFSLEEKVQRPLAYAIVDEVDSILIDEARTPLIISGAVEGSSDLYHAVDRIIPQLSPQLEEEGPGDFTVDEKQKQAYLTEAGHQRAEQLLTDMELLVGGESLYHPQNILLLHHLNAALRAHHNYTRDVDYIVTPDHTVVIIDEHTGRAMSGRRWGEGLHQAVEAKEGVSIQRENQTLASITFQNFFRLYGKLAGMTGTADTEAYEFQQIYNLEVVVMPTHRPMVRKDLPDLVYLSKTAKYRAIIADVKAAIAKQQPVLLGTASIETSEYLAQVLSEEKVKHRVLNAKFHEAEAAIIAEAGMPGTVTIATNMAGRGTDIVLGGNLSSELAQLPATATDAEREQLRTAWQQRHDAVIKAGGLHIIGSERHESRRIDNQLRGRAGRQGDPGSSRFYLSLEDDLMRIFAPERVSQLMQTLGMQEDEPISHRMITRSIENAQRKVEGRNFDIRKHLLEFDNVANDQRKVIYQQRHDMLVATNLTETVDAIREAVVVQLVARYVPPESMAEMWDISGLDKHLANDFGLRLGLEAWLQEDDGVHETIILQRVQKALADKFAEKCAVLPASDYVQLEKSVSLQTLDTHWREHLAAMDELRQGIHLRGYAQRDPKQEYKREAFQLFSSMLDAIQFDIVRTISLLQIADQSEVEALEAQRRLESERELDLIHAAPTDASTEDPSKVPPMMRAGPKIGRNEPCPCGSNRKFKQCCGKV
jgi:preprotein translocase subunit SecA